MDGPAARGSVATVDATDIAIDGIAIRTAGATALAAALADARAQTLRAFDAYVRALPDLRVPQRAELNLPLWELGHIGWFQEWWTLRNPQWRRGWHAQPNVPRGPALRAGADRLYDSSRVAHASRWSLALPPAQSTRDELSQQLEATLALLAAAPDDDAALYFFRLSVLHEDMHREAAAYMAQSLGIAFDALTPAPAAPARAAGSELSIAATEFTLGSDDIGFAFDNERGAHAVTLDAFRIDSQVRRWRDVLPFIDAGGYTDAALWTEAGDAWRRATGAQAPRHLRRTDAGWQVCRFGRWQPLDLDAPACHLTAHEAQAWCRWAGRRLPTEAEWERAATAGAAAFCWGEVWEWTASAFAP
ncbi:MAG: SUMF1/EgtB/PvdO family nonheme iron enzyme, partial [Burkholderiaceae bacterium]|nr:SUMF1/EgtB/PvdO family nonheme iron enzyme [Burkholderiaceae bacterium]